MSMSYRSRWITRRSFLHGVAAAGGSLVAARVLSRPVLADTAKPSITHGVQSGDILTDRAIIWARADRPSQMLVDWSLDESFARATRVPGPNALVDGDFTARLDLIDLPAGQDIHYRVQFEDLANPGSIGEPVTGRLRTAPAAPRNIRFVFSGDEAGQGWGINPAWGGYRIY